MAAVSNGLKKERKCEGHNIVGPTNPMVTPLLTDLYQFTMAYAYWKAGKHNERAVEDDIAFRQQSLPSSCEDGFFEYLRSIDLSDVEIYSISEGSVVFPKVPLMRVEGPVAVAQLLETPFVNRINYASLVTTNAARHRFVAGKEKLLLEFGLRRAQGPDGGIGASKYCYMGGFDATSFLALVDTYDVIRSGVPNFCAVALALNDLGYKAIGIRLDSGDLAYQSCEARKFFCAIEKEFGVPGFGKMSITASNDLNEETLDALNKQGHEVDAFGIGTHLVTCYAQAALGVVFKLVEINNQPRIKLSEDVTKVSIPCKKRRYRLYGKEGYPLVDIMTGENEPPPKVGERILCRHPFSESKRAYVVPQRVEELLKCYWPGSSDKTREVLPPLKQIRERCIEHLSQMRPDHMRWLNPTPYKVSVSAKLYDFIHFLWLNEAPVGELQ
nr:nicotinate phosphoribosyltransferase isoform X1 [Ipomoea trifida]